MEFSILQQLVVFLIDVIAIGLGVMVFLVELDSRHKRKVQIQIIR